MLTLQKLVHNVENFSVKRLHLRAIVPIVRIAFKWSFQFEITELRKMSISNANQPAPYRAFFQFYRIYRGFGK